MLEAPVLTYVAEMWACSLDFRRVDNKNLLISEPLRLYEVCFPLLEASASFSGYFRSSWWAFTSIGEP